MRSKKTSTIFLTVLFAATTAFGCWYNKISYNDYIFGVNNFERHAEATITKDENNKPTTAYRVQNNMIVDFPLTVTMKLVSDSAIIIDDNNMKSNILQCALQYRVLPNGNWTTVEEYKVPTGSIPMSAPPAAYFGRNNIWPKNCKAGDVVMVRLYVTDGIFQSGDLSDKCTNKLDYVSTAKYGLKYTLPNEFSYVAHNVESMENVDLGGMWTPQYVMTVIYSGKSRPIQ